MRGKTVVVTGANSGIGLATAEALAGQGARVWMACRNPKKAEAARDHIRAQHPEAELELVGLDLARFASVREAAARILEGTERIDVLVNNAGLYLPERQTTEDGLEATVQINHFGPFLLTSLLAPRLVHSAPARVVSVASAAHRGGRLDFDDLQSERHYRAFQVYGTSKLMNIMHVRALARRLDPKKVTANALHPGVVATGFAQDEPSLLGKLVQNFGFLLRNSGDGAKTSLHLATHPEGGETTGGYFANAKPKRPRRAALDDALGERLWEVSERLSGAPAWPVDAPLPA